MDLSFSGTILVVFVELGGAAAFSGVWRAMNHAFMSVIIWAVRETLSPKHGITRTRIDIQEACSSAYSCSPYLPTDGAVHSKPS